jgi:hypothetical protein
MQVCEGTRSQTRQDALCQLLGCAPQGVVRRALALEFALALSVAPPLPYPTHKVLRTHGGLGFLDQTLHITFVLG